MTTSKTTRVQAMRCEIFERRPLLRCGSSWSTRIQGYTGSLHLGDGKTRRLWVLVGSLLRLVVEVVIDTSNWAVAPARPPAEPRCERGELTYFLQCRRDVRRTTMAPLSSLLR
jgi:hypothetical protein